jgi:hypothetical protein
MAPSFDDMVFLSVLPLTSPITEDEKDGEQQTN